MQTENHAESRWPPLVRIKVARTEILPVGTTKFWQLVKRGVVELAYVGGTPFVKTESLLRLIEGSPRTRTKASSTSSGTTSTTTTA